MINPNQPSTGMSVKSKTILILVVVALVVTIGTAVAISVFSVQSTSQYPAGLPTPTPVPTATPVPLTNSFTMSATLNGAAVADPRTITIPAGAYIGTIYTTVYTFTSTANQPITVGVTAPTGTTGNMIISWDTATQASGYTVFLAGNGAQATMTMQVSLGTVGGDIPLVFTASP
jgi:hypothetical protein